MKSTPIQRATVKASSLTTKLCHQYNRTQFVAYPDLITWFEVIGYTVMLEPDLISGRHRAERSSYGEVVLPNRLRNALQRINPTMPSEAIAAAICQATSDYNKLGKRSWDYLTRYTLILMKYLK